MNENDSISAASGLPHGEAGVPDAAPGGFVANESEEMPMLDVHVPHPTHTWRDFWIHLGTIAAGLLIAISLEQSVEALHRLHERHALEKELRQENEVNLVHAEIDLGWYDARMVWLLGLRKDIDTMLATGGKANLTYRAFQPSPFGHGLPGRGAIDIQTTVWDTAKADGRLALLPDPVKAAYGLVYLRHARWDGSYSAVADVGRRTRFFESQFADVGTLRTPVLSRMSTEQLTQYRALVMESFEQTMYQKDVTVRFYGDCRFALAGDFDGDAQSQEVEVMKAESDAAAAYPTDIAKMALEGERPQGKANP